MHSQRVKDEGRTRCKACGEQIQYLPTYFGYRFKPHNMDHSRHDCPGPKSLKIYTEEEKKEFERKRFAGEI